MSSLHTKYRPNELDQFRGNSTVVKGVEKAFKAKRAHTFLFTGPPGTGKTTLSRILANLLIGGSPSLANIEEFNAASHSGADAVRAVVQRTFYRAIGGSPVKAIIIDEAHRLSATAWDVLLKPLEEPHEHVYWMLCTTTPAKIPKAILTRCLRFDLKPLAEEGILHLLDEVCEAEGIKPAEGVLEAISENCEGSPRQALVYLESCQFCETEAEALKIMRQAGQSKEIIDLCRFLLDGRGTWPDAIRLVKSMENVDAQVAALLSATT